MVQRIGGFRRKTRFKLQKSLQKRGKVSISKYLQDLEIGQRVQLTAEPAVQKGMYFPRYHGLMGIVKAKKGACYEVVIKDQDKKKTLIVHPVHLSRVE